MKLIFIVLLVANILFFGSQFLNGDKAAESTPSSKSTRQFGNLQTLAERDAKGGKSTPKDANKKFTPAESVTTSSSADEQCQLIGPFAELLHAEFLVERLTGLDVPAVIKHIEIADGKNYWVYLKPEMSEKEALRRLNEIQQGKGIDSYIIPSGELANGISFGQFSNAKDAADKADQIRSKGYAAEIKEIPKSHSEIWVEVKEKTDQKLSAEHWLELLKEEKGIERRQNYCFAVAH